MNLYAYCNNNPVNWIDPWGLEPDDDDDDDGNKPKGHGVVGSMGGGGGSYDQAVRYKQVEVSAEITIFDIGGTILGVGAGVEVTIGADGNINISGNIGPFGGTVTIHGGEGGSSGPEGTGPFGGIHP